MAAPLGNQNAAKGRLWAAAINRAIASRSKREGVEILESLADKLIDAALDGDLPALKEIGDRLDGKPSQQIVGAGDIGEHLISIIERRIVKPDN